MKRTGEVSILNQATHTFRWVGALPRLALCGVMALGFAWSHGPAARADQTPQATLTTLQEALNRAHGTWSMPPGRHEISSPLLWDLRQGHRLAIHGQGTTLVMKGPGPAIRLIGGFTRGNAAPQNVPAVVKERESGCSIRGLRIEGGHPEADGLEINGTMELTLSGVAIRGCRHGVHLRGLNRNLLINACHIYDNSGVGVFYDQVNLHQSNISACHISYCKQGGVVARGGDVRNIQITGCDIEANTGAPGPATANVLLDSTGGSVAEVAITGCTIQHARGEDTANIRILGKGVDARGAPTREGHFTITGNVLSDVAVNLDLADCRSVSVLGNTFWMGHEHNLRAVRCAQLVVGPNPMERNPRYEEEKKRSASNSVWLRECQDLTLQGLHLHQANRAKAGLILEDIQGLTMTGCSVLDCEPLGVLFLRVRDGLVSGCRVRSTGKRGQEIQAVGCRDLQLLANNFGLPAFP